jgi:hypothetical protein
MKLVFKRSVLIEVYQSVHRIIENNFYMENRTICHTQPSMIVTLRKLADHIQKTENNPHVFTKGLSAKHEVLDALNEGLAAIVESSDLCNIPDDKAGVRAVLATSGDIGVV